MLDQRLHRGVVAIEFAKLDREAFAQVACAYAGRIEFLQHREHRLDIRLRRAEPFGGLPEINRHVAGIVDEVDQVLADHALHRRGKGNGELLGEMAAERHFGGDKGFQIVVFVVGGAAAPFGIGGRRGVLRHARGGLGGLFGEDVVERGIERLLDFGAGAEIPVQPFFLAGLERIARGAAGHVRSLAAGIVAIALRFTGIGEFGALGSRLARDRGFRAVAGALQQRIALQFLLDEGRKVEIRQLQQLDRLHQLRRHDQRLRLAEF